MKGRERVRYDVRKDFPVIFGDLLKKFPQLDPQRLINAVIKNNFLMYRDRVTLPIPQMFYVGATALFEEWCESGKGETIFEEFFQRSFTKISKEIYSFLKYECPWVRVGVLFVDNVKDMDKSPDHGPKADELLASKEALEQFFSTTTPKTKALFEHYLLGHEGEEIANKFGISSNCDGKAKLGAIKTRFRLSIEKARKVFGVDWKAPICLHDNYERKTPDEKREKTSLNLKKYREKLRREKEEGWRK